MIIARAGLLVMVAVDTAMIGHYSTEHLAFYAAANAIQIVMVLIGVGLLQGTMIFVAQAHGAKAYRECGRYWQVGLINGFLLGLLMLGVCFFGETILGSIGQSDQLSTGAADVLRMIAWGLPAMAMWVVTAFFLEGLSRPLPGMIVTILAVVLNAVLNFVFIYGNLGAAEMGAEGSALATSITRWLMFLALLVFVLLMSDRSSLGIGTQIPNWWETAYKLFRLGIPMGASRGLETAAFSALTMMAGVLGNIPLAGYQIAFNLVALVFMCAIGVASAATIRVGNAVGESNSNNIIQSGWSAFILISFIMLFFAAIFLLLGMPLAQVYTDDLSVILVAGSLIFIAGFVLLFDGGQAVLMGALRGVGDIWLPPLLQFFSWWGVAVPVAYALAFYLDMGVSGLMWGILAGSIVSCGSLGLRFSTVSRRTIQRV